MKWPAIRPNYSCGSEIEVSSRDETPESQVLDFTACWPFSASRRSESFFRQGEVFQRRFFGCASDGASRTECGSAGDGSCFWGISAPSHTDDDIAYPINGALPVLLTGDASHSQLY
jgi:hypothetical protein